MQFTVCVLHVPNMDKALTFYRDTLGLPVRYASEAYVEFDLAPATLALHHTEHSEEGTRGVGLFLVVDNVDALAAKLQEKGLSAIQPLADQDFGYRTVMYMDPFGNRVELATPLPQRP
nr:glyoxalase superfamily protein [Ardenticatena sp.]